MDYERAMSSLKTPLRLQQRLEQWCRRLQEAQDPMDVRIPATDGLKLEATFLEPKGDLRGAVLLNAATAVKRSFYAPYASYLAEQGFAVLTYDYRGVGGSRPAQLRGFRASMQEWATKDAAGAFAWLKARTGSGPVFVVGHSFGGQALGLMPAREDICAALIVGAQSGYFGHWSGFPRLRVWFLWHVLVPSLCRLLGYFPGRLMRLGEDLPAGVAGQWAHWGRHRAYLMRDEQPQRRADFSSLAFPIRAYSFSDDAFAPRPAAAALLGLYTSASVEHLHFEPRDLGELRIGHWGFFRERFRDTLWRASVDWLRAARPT